MEEASEGNMLQLLQREDDKGSHVDDDESGGRGGLAGKYVNGEEKSKLQLILDLLLDTAHNIGTCLLLVATSSLINMTVART